MMPFVNPARTDPGPPAAPARMLANTAPDNGLPNVDDGEPWPWPTDGRGETALLPGTVDVESDTG